MFKRYGDEVVLTRVPDTEGREPTEAQLKSQELFRQAVVYGRTVMADEATKAIYAEAAKAKGKPVFSLMVGDFRNAPSIDEVDVSGYAGQVGDPIRVRAHDDFMVTGVSLSLTQADGQTIESGEAVETPPKSGQWIYTATQAVSTGTMVRIAVTAKDRPGGKGETQKEKAI